MKTGQAQTCLIQRLQSKGLVSCRFGIWLLQRAFTGPFHRPYTSQPTSGSTRRLMLSKPAYAGAQLWLYKHIQHINTSSCVARKEVEAMSVTLTLLAALACAWTCGGPGLSAP